VSTVDELVSRGRGLGQNSEPREGIRPLVTAHDRRRQRTIGHADTAVASGDVVTREAHRTVETFSVDHRRVVGEAANEFHLRVEQQLGAGVKAQRHQILHHLLLTVDGDGFARREVAQSNAVRRTLETNLDAVMHEALIAHARTRAGLF